MILSNLFLWQSKGKCKKTFGNRHRGTQTRGLELDILKCDSSKPICWVWIQTQSMSSSKPLILPLCLNPNLVFQLGPISMFKDSKSFEKVVTLDCQDYRCLEQGIMTYIILGLERAFIMDFYLLGIMLQFPINIWPKYPFCDRQSQNSPFSRLYF